MSLSAAEAARLDSFMLAIAGEARGTPVSNSSGDWRFGSSKSALCVYANGQYHDFSGGARPHGHSALELIQHLCPDADAIAWARDWLAQHAGDGSFTAQGESEPVDDFAEVEAIAFLERLYEGAAPIEGTPGYAYITQTRGLPLRPEDQAGLRWVAGYRGDEGALLAPVTDDASKLVKLLVTHVTADGRKSPYGAGRSTIRGAKRPGLCRLGSPGSNVVETEGLEKGLAVRAGGAEYVVVTGSASTLGKIPLPPEVRSVVIARDADPAASPADQALWRGAVRRLGQDLKVAVTARPNDIAPKDAPFLKDLDDVWRHDPDLVSMLLKGANLEHGRLGEAVGDAIYEEASRLQPGALSHARKGIIALLRISLGALDDELGLRVRARVAAREAAMKASGAPTEELHPDPVTDLGAVLDEGVRVAKTHVAAPDTHFDTTALWCVHAHLVHHEILGVNITPRLAPQSPEEDSGKSTLLKIIRALVPRPKGVGSLTGSSLFRAVEARKVTLLVDEADNVFHANANPDLLAIFNSGNERTFAFVSRSIPLGDGKFEDYDFNTYTAMAFTSIGRLPIKSMQSRCISLPMRPATKEEAAKLVRFRSDHCPELKVCGRKIARWAADVSELPDVEVPGEFVNRIADNWRNLFQIAAVAGGTWPERVLAAARADLAGDVEKQENRGAGGLLGAIWDIFAVEVTDPRRMHTQDLIMKLLDLDEGRWRVANKGKPIDEWYLRSKLRDYVVKTTGSKEMPPRQWRSPSTGAQRKGYHELHFEDAFERYLGKGLPSKAPAEEGPADKAEPKPTSSPSTPHISAPSAPEAKTLEMPEVYGGADAGTGADEISAPRTLQPGEGGADEVSAPHTHPPSAPEINDQDQNDTPKLADGADGADALGHPERDLQSNVTKLPVTPAGRKRRGG